ncbi:hypothetical protein ACFO0M_10035 [Micromonospora mangrovi]|uniref:Uncharacterized protein n=2 Tax=Micromonospora TaxID=1873 RepID=A0AAU7M8M0_9ACTN
MTHTDSRAVDALLDHQLTLARVCKEQQKGLTYAWGRVDELHQAVTTADAHRDRYREQADRANAERLRLAEELATVQAANRHLETKLRQAIGSDLRSGLVTSLVAALIVNAAPAGPSAFELAAHLLGELANMTDGREPTLGQPTSTGRWGPYCACGLSTSVPAGHRLHRPHCDRAPRPAQSGPAARELPAAPATPQPPAKPAAAAGPAPLTPWWRRLGTRTRPARHLDVTTTTDTPGETA